MKVLFKIGCLISLIICMYEIVIGKNDLATLNMLNAILCQLCVLEYNCQKKL